MSSFGEPRGGVEIEYIKDRRVVRLCVWVGGVDVRSRWEEVPLRDLLDQLGVPDADLRRVIRARKP